MAAGQAAMALEVGLLGAAGNLQLPWSPVKPSADAVFPADNYFWGGEAWLAAPLGEDAAIRVSYERDPVTRNGAIAAVQFERGIARISVGPRFGFLNTDSVPFSIGLSSSVRLQWPGVAYLSMRSDGGTAISVLSLDSDPQARTELAAGFYVPNAIVSGILTAKRFNELDSAGGLVTDSLTRYAMTIDVYKKNVPYTALLTMGYELRSKHFATGDVTDSLGAVILGLDSSVQLGRAFKLLGGISTGAFVFGIDDLKGRGPKNSSFLFSADLGLAVETSALDFKPKPKAEKPLGAEAAPKGPEAEAEAAEAAPASKDVPEAKGVDKKPLAIEAGTGLYYDAYPLTGSLLDFLVWIYNLRGGAWGDLMIPIKGGLSLGGEVGAFYMTNDKYTAGTIDLPLHAKAAYRLGKLGIEGVAGLFTSAVIDPASSTYDFFLGLDAGARLRLGGFYLEGGYVYGLGELPSFPRFGLGFTFPIVAKK
jgi:hypothetical protein